MTWHEALQAVAGNRVGANAGVGDLATAAAAAGITCRKARHAGAAASALITDFAPQVATSRAGTREGISTLVGAAVQARRQ